MIVITRVSGSQSLPTRRSSHQANQSKGYRLVLMFINQPWVFMQKLRRNVGLYRPRLGLSLTAWWNDLPVESAKSFPPLRIIIIHSSSSNSKLYMIETCALFAEEIWLVSLRDPRFCTYEERVGSLLIRNDVQVCKGGSNHIVIRQHLRE